MRQGEFDSEYTQWVWVNPDQFAGNIINNVIGINPDFQPEIDATYTQIRMKIVKIPSQWNTEGYFAQPGYQDKEYWDNPTRGDVSTQSFTSDPFIIPAGVDFSNIEARVWFGTDYSFSDDGIYSATPSPDATRGYITYLTDAPVVNVDCSLGPLFSLTLTGDHALGTLTNMKDGQIIGIILRQDATGNRTFDIGGSIPAMRFGSTVKESDYVLSTAANAQDYLILAYNAKDNVFDVVSFTPGYVS